DIARIGGAAARPFRRYRRFMLVGSRHRAVHLLIEQLATDFLREAVGSEGVRTALDDRHRAFPAGTLKHKTCLGVVNCGKNCEWRTSSQRVDERFIDSRDITGEPRLRKELTESMPRGVRLISAIRGIFRPE